MKRLAALLFALALLCPSLAFGQAKSGQWSQNIIIPNASAYTAGQCIGGIQILPNMLRPQGPGGTVVENISIIDPQHQTAANDAMTLIFFAALPTGTYTDHATCSIAAADAPFVLGHLNVASGNCVQDGGPATTICTIDPATFNLSGNTFPITSGALWMLAIAVGTPTYGAGAKLYFNVLSSPF